MFGQFTEKRQGLSPTLKSLMIGVPVVAAIITLLVFTTKGKSAMLEVKLARPTLVQPAEVVVRLPKQQPATASKTATPQTTNPQPAPRVAIRKFAFPSAIPKIAVAEIAEVPPAVYGGPGNPGPGSGGTGVCLDCLIGNGSGGVNVAPPPPKAPAPKPPRPNIIPVGGRVQNAKLVRHPDPVYPQLARNTRISGVVELSAIIGEDGRIQELKVVSGHPLLRQAALDAVKQWVYQPTLLNEQPVQVATTIQVVFTLAQ